MSDQFLGTCVALEFGFPCGQPTSSSRHDFCADHLEHASTANGDNFGRCYHCHGGDHGLCIGVPCQCACPTPEQRTRAAIRQRAIDKLTPEEIAALGIR